MPHLGNRQPGKTCQMHRMLVLACVQSAVKGDRKEFFLGLSCHCGLITVFSWCCISLHLPTGADNSCNSLPALGGLLQTLHCVNFSQSPFPSPLPMLLAAKALQIGDYSVVNLFCICPFLCDEKLRANFGSKTSLQPLSICRFSWEELSAFERFSSKLLRDWHPLEVVSIVTISC